MDKFLPDLVPSAGLTRRSWLSALAAAPVIAASLSAPAIAKSRAKGIERVLELRHRHTGEQLKLVYKANGQYVPENLRRIDRVLRDWRTGEVKPIDPELLDLLWDLRRKLETGNTIDILSGYRAPATNAMLRRKGGGVAKNSFHIQGKAIDLKIAGRSTRQIRDAAVALKRGGVGYYPASHFVHVDTGAPRTWSF